MSDQDAVIETVRHILSDFEPFVLTAERRWDAGLWEALAEAGMTGVGVPEALGGSGGELADAVAIVQTVASAAGAVPVAEQLLVAGPSLVAAHLELPPPEQPLTFAVGDAVTVQSAEGNADDGQFTLSGSVRDVAWMGAVSHVVLMVPAPAGIDGAVVALLDASSLPTTYARNLAGEPRGSLELDLVDTSGTLLTEVQARGLRARYALARAVQLSAAMETVLAWTVEYVGQRHQFGRPLGKFQAIQMQLAEMAGEVTAVTALTDAAVQALDRGENSVLAAAAAKARAGAAVEVVARSAHQVHGALGFTQEHKLHHLTRRLWSWRDEAGSDLAWARVLGSGLLAGGSENLWPSLTRVV